MCEDRTQRLNEIKGRLMDAVNDELKAGEASTMEVLAVLAYSVGQCIALQDMTKVTPQIAMDMVLRNIAAGNMDIVKNHPRPKG